MDSDSTQNDPANDDSASGASEKDQPIEIEVSEEHAEESIAEEESDTPREPSKFVSYMRLCRIPNVFTAFADIAMGYLFVNRGGMPWQPLVALLAASGLLYTAGMVLNDVFDVEADRKERPHRPIPSGAISFGQARTLGFGLLFAGVLMSLAAGTLGEPALPWRSGGIGMLLALTIVLYDGILKKTILAPWLMGGCRFLNVLLGMSLATKLDASMATVGFANYQLAAAGGLGLYIVGVTWFARAEAKERSRVLLGLGATLMVSGLALLTLIPEVAPRHIGFHLSSTAWPIVVMVLMVAPLRRCVLAIANPSPKRVQAAIKQCILSLIVLNAALVLLTNPFGYALAVCALLAPTLLIGRWIYST